MPRKDASALGSSYWGAEPQFIVPFFSGRPIADISYFVVIFFWIKRLEQHEKWQAVALALILGGALGNVIDRIWLGYVVDFIQIYYQTYYWPSFNIADSAIVVGAAILIIDGLFSMRSDKVAKIN